MQIGLVLIDLQNDYFPGGRYELHRSEQAVEQAEKILRFFRTWALPVFHVQHVHLAENAPFFVQGTEGSQIHERVSPHQGEPVIVKHAPDSFFQTNLKQELEQRKVNQLVVCGMMTHMCVDSTIRTAGNFGYNVIMIEDACATRALKWKERALSASMVQAVFAAALNKRFAEIMTASEWKRWI